MLSQKRVIARGKIFRTPVTVQGAYVQTLLKHFDAMAAEVQRSLTDLFANDFAQAHFEHPTVGMDVANLGSQSRILVNAMKKKFDGFFGAISGDLAKDMVNGLNRTSAAQSKANVKDLPGLKDRSKELTISLNKLDKSTLTILNAATGNASDFIKTIPEKYLNSVATAVYNSITSGNGLQDLIPFFEKFDIVTRNWVHNTAMDQTRKAFNGLNRGRMLKIGVTQAEWIHSAGSQTPRELHVDFDGKTFDLNEGAPVGDDDGNMVQPGEEPYCRCTFGPVLTEDDAEDADDAAAE